MFQSSCLSEVDLLLSQVNVLLSEINVKLSSCRDVNIYQLLPRCGNILSEMEFVVKFAQEVECYDDDGLDISLEWDHDHNITNLTSTISIMRTEKIMTSLKMMKRSSTR